MKIDAWSLRDRVRVGSFALLVVALAGWLRVPLRSMLDGSSGSGALGVAGTSAVVLAAVVASVYGCHGVARAFAKAWVRSVEEVSADVARAATAESQGRGGGGFLEDRALPQEVRQLQGRVRHLHALMYRRAEADRAVLGATVHDLRAGLAGLQHLLDTEGRQAGLTRRASDPVLAAARGEARRLNELLSAMLGFLRSGHVAPGRSVRVDLTELVTGIAGRVAGQDGDVSVRTRSHGAVSVSGDPVLLEQAMGNLVANAVRVARTVVDVTVFPGVVRIEDDGPGLPGDLDALVAPFASRPLDDGERAIAAGSLGLGMYIAYRILEVHGGGLAIERSDARGTVLLAYVSGARA